MKKEKVVLAAFGEGGHESQMNRLICGLEEGLALPVISLTDSTREYHWSHKRILLPEVRDKHRRDTVGAVKRIAHLFIMFRKIASHYDIEAVISTGPGVAFFVALYFKCFASAKVIHIETWSRFYSRSLTGKLIYRIADKFYVQNEELLALYPNAEFSGRL